MCLTDYFAGVKNHIFKYFKEDGEKAACKNLITILLKIHYILRKRTL